MKVGKFSVIVEDRLTGRVKTVEVRGYLLPGMIFGLDSERAGCFMRGPWTLTHRPTGYRVGYFKSRAAGAKCARALMKLPIRWFGLSVEDAESHPIKPRVREIVEQFKGW